MKNTAKADPVKIDKARVDQKKLIKGNAGIFIFSVFIIAAGLRILLFLSNPPTNAFDDHFTPIDLIMQTGEVPAKDACWQCYQPPVFYGISAMFGKFAIEMGLNKIYLPKVLQFLCCLYGILHLAVVYLILNKMPLSRFSSAIAFATACFLPPHIYISAMNSNDTLSYLLAAICVYILLIAIERKLGIPWSIALGIAATVAIFTKYTAFAIIPPIMAGYLIILFKRIISPAKKVIISMVAVFLLPLLFLSLHIASNMRNYGIFLSSNADLFEPAVHQPSQKINFFSFKPWKMMERQILYPDTLDSFWTLLYGEMWFDVEPKFIYFTDVNNDPWWGHYDGWLRGKEPFPAEVKKLSFITRFTGRGLMALGMVPLLISMAGLLRIIFGRWSLWRKPDGVEMVKMQIFPMLLLCNLAGVVYLALNNPVYSSIKAIYILNSLPALAVLLGAGTMLIDKHKIIKTVVGGLFAVLFILVILHILYIVFGFLFFP